MQENLQIYLCGGLSKKKKKQQCCMAESIDIDSFFDFSVESLEGDSDVCEGDWNSKLQCIGPIPSDLQGDLGPISCDGINNGCFSACELQDGGLSVSCDNINHEILQIPSTGDKTCQPKQLPNFVEESSVASTPVLNDSSDGLQLSIFQASSPVSVLENRNLCSASIPARSRSKRPRRPSTSKPWLKMPCDSRRSNRSTAHESFSQFYDYSTPHLPRKMSNSVKKLKKKKKVSLLSSALKLKANSSLSQSSDATLMKEKWLQKAFLETKKCRHCEVTETPQWREGPMGPKTLCNACGVRYYKSGCLFPKYRPAASPTFDPSLHSSSHRKVIETKRFGHCEDTKTPQWREGPTGPNALCNACGVWYREGPMGPNTLCNACRVRYRSGHLFPEYCPAANPTFVPSLHSNSHRKVTETKRCRKVTETKRCRHCGVTKTPQWREGPKGPSTLCNACGVRYRSGRLFPEYRPAASPTFVPSLHSNSHKKVIEMRNRCNQEAAMAEMDTAVSSSPI